MQERKTITAEISSQALYNRLKQRVMEKLYEEPYQNDDGVWVDPLPARDLGLMGGLIMKMVKHEEDKEAREGGQVNVMAIPALPPIVKE
jgi:hypothetical protein